MLIILVLKGGPGSGWYGPPKGTHSGEKHRQVGSGKSYVETGYGKADLDTVSKRISSVIPVRHTYRGISSAQFKKVLGGTSLTSRGERMLAAAGKRGELQTTNNLVQALAHAQGGVLIAIPISKTISKRAFADIRRVRGDSLELGDITVAFDASTGNIIHR